MHNISDGFDGRSNAESIKLLRYSQRSASSIQSQWYVALEQGYIHHDEFSMLYDLADHAKANIDGFISYLLRSAWRK